MFFLIELSLSGETVLEWEDADLEHYHYQRMAMDSMLCRFKTIYPTERIDSVRHLLEDKERQMRKIMQVFEQQQAINDKITRQVPIIVQKSVQEQPQKPKRKGFLGIFGKKEKPKPTVTTTMLRSLDRDMIAEQRAQSRRLSEYTDSLASRNAELNRQLYNRPRQQVSHKKKPSGFRVGVFLCLFPAVREQVAVFFDRGVLRPCGTSVDDVAEVVEDVDSALMAGAGVSSSRP